MDMVHLDDASADASGASSLDPPSLSPDELFHTLQNERRRFVIQYLLRHSEPVSVPTLVDQVTAWELQTTVDDIPEDQRERVYVDLCQSQLPKLDEQGFVDYDESRSLVEPGASLEAVDPKLLSGQPAEEAATEPTDDDSRAWLDYYVLTTGISALLVGLAAFGPLVAISLSFKLVATLVAGLYAVVTTGLFVERAV